MDEIDNVRTPLVNSIQTAFFTKFGKTPSGIIASPARINIIGEHTDYNGGLVLPAAIDRHIFFAFAKNETSICRFYANDFSSYHEIDLEDTQVVPDAQWARYLQGVIHFFILKNIKIEGFDCLFGGNIPAGAGLSSSAALSCGVAYLLNHLFALRLSNWQLADAAQWAEHHFVGVRCGIMDQAANLFGKKNQALLLDCTTRVLEYHECNTKKYRFLLLDTKAKHSLAESAYNERRATCEKVLTILNKALDRTNHYLCDYTLEDLHRCRAIIPLEAFEKADFVLEEHQRVLAACKALENSDFISLGKLLYESHKGLSKKYEVSCEELDYLVTFTKKQSQFVGARMMGGGFGGCTLNLVTSDYSSIDFTTLKEEYFKKFRKELSIYEVDISSGTLLL